MKKYIILGVFIYLIYWFGNQAYQGLTAQVCAFPTTQPELSLMTLMGDNALYCGILYAFVCFILSCLAIIIGFTLHYDD